MKIFKGDNFNLYIFYNEKNSIIQSIKVGNIDDKIY